MFITLVLLHLFLAVNAQWDGTECQTPDRQSGLCIPATTCKTMQDYLNKFPRPIPKEILKKLKPYHCGKTSNGRPKICCPTKPIEHENQDMSNNSGSAQSGEYPDVTNHRNFKLLPKNCGNALFDKIVNGNVTSLFEFPWMALLSYRDGNTLDFLCGGTIVNERYILTAAHCVTNLGKQQLVGVRVGEHNIRTKVDCEIIDEDTGEEECAPPVQDLSIEQVIFHKDYSPRSLVHDIALLRVSPIDLSQENSQPVCLPVGSARIHDYGKLNVVVTGWGATEKGSKSPILLKAEISHVPLEECQKKYKSLKLLKSQMCAGGDSISDSCSGDSGGPLHALSFLNDKPRYVQRGIVSFGPKDCGKLPLPGIYTRVVSYMDWILDNIKP